MHNAGQGCTGKGVTIAVVDSGLDIKHEDLVDRVIKDKSFNFANNSNDPSPAANAAKIDHGTGVAGVAAATGWNGKGSRGIAPLASLVGFAPLNGGSDYLRFGAATLADDKDAAKAPFGTRVADAKVAIFNYSAGSDYALPPSVPAADTSEATGHQAARWGVKNGRDGKGFIYLQAAGNEYQKQKGGLGDNPNTIDADCSTDALNALLTKANLGSVSAGVSCGDSNQSYENKPYMYQIASINNKGVASSYSNASAATWVTGFGGEFGGEEAAMVTTDNTGCGAGADNPDKQSNSDNVEVLRPADGWKAYFAKADAFLKWFPKRIADLFGTSSKDPNCNYTGTMNGTSSAAPSVAGVVALMLEANPNLTWQDVGFILAKTAKKVDANSQKIHMLNNDIEGRTLQQPWVTNAAGFNFHNRYGFGMVDATAAVALAKNFTTPAGRRTGDIDSSKIKLDWSSSATPTIDKTSNHVVFALQPSQPAAADSKKVTGTVQLDIKIEKTDQLNLNLGQVQFEIISPSGNKSIVLPAFTSFYQGSAATSAKDADGKSVSVTPSLWSDTEKSFRLFTNAFYGEELAKDGKAWTVNVVVIGSPNTTFTFKNMSLTSYGM
ncbi:MAG: hypothetical protein RJB34_1406 [Pseudomonadota bacterium]